MNILPALIRSVPSSPHLFPKRCAPSSNFLLLLLLCVTFLLMVSAFDIKDMLSPLSFVPDDQYVHQWVPYDGIPSNTGQHSKHLPSKHAPPSRPHWKTIELFKAMGSKKTYPFSVPQNWRFLWSCGNTEQDYYSLTIEVDRPDGSVVDPIATITQCQQTITNALVQEHKGGIVYLNVDSDSGWTIQVQVLTSYSAKIIPTKWKTQQLLKGNGDQKTRTFTVPHHWQIRWQCTLSRKKDIDVLFADLSKTNNVVADPEAINAICKSGNTTDWTQEYKPGTYNLNVFSNTAWSLQIQIPQ